MADSDNSASNPQQPDPQANSNPPSDNSSESSQADLTNHQQLTAAIQTLDSLNAQLGVAGALLVSHYQTQKQKEAAAAPPPYPYPPQSYPPQPYSGANPTPQPYSTGSPYPNQAPPQPYPNPGYPPPPPYGQPYPQPAPSGYSPQPFNQSPAPVPPQQATQPSNQPAETPGSTPTSTGTGNPPPLSQDLASLANIITQIQYDIFDINVHLAQPDSQQKFDTRIEDKAITWIKDLITKINSQLPPNQDPVLPVGSQLACEFYRAKTLSQQAQTTISIFYEQHPEFKPSNYSLINDYLSNLINLMFVIFRWANLVMGEKEWFWKTKDQMQTAAPADQQSAPQSPPNQPPSPGNPSLPKN